MTTMVGATTVVGVRCEEVHETNMEALLIDLVRVEELTTVESRCEAVLIESVVLRVGVVKEMVEEITNTVVDTATVVRWVRSESVFLSVVDEHVLNLRY